MEKTSPSNPPWHFRQFPQKRSILGCSDDPWSHWENGGGPLGWGPLAVLTPYWSPLKGNWDPWNTHYIRCSYMGLIINLEGIYSEFSFDNPNCKIWSFLWNGNYMKLLSISKTNKSFASTPAGWPGPKTKRVHLPTPQSQVRFASPIDFEKNTPWKLNSSPLKRYLDPIGKANVFQSHHFSGARC